MLLDEPKFQDESCKLFMGIGNYSSSAPAVMYFWMNLQTALFTPWNPDHPGARLLGIILKNIPENNPVHF